MNYLLALTLLLNLQCLGANLGCDDPTAIRYHCIRRLLLPALAQRAEVSSFLSQRKGMFRIGRCLRGGQSESVQPSRKSPANYTEENIDEGLHVYIA